MKIGLALLLASAGAFASVPAQAQTYSSNFSNLGTQGVSGQGYYFFIGDTASQSYVGTGLSSVIGLDLNLNSGENGNNVSQPLTLTFQVNGVNIGTTTYNPGDAVGRNLSFGFGSIVSGTTNYTLTALVSGPVCSGCGALQFGSENPFTLRGLQGAVPEPSTWAMMLMGFGAIGYGVRRQLKTAAALAA